MRRADKEITDLKEMETIIKHAQVCRLGLCKDNQPYVVPMNFGYDNRIFYFHSAPMGRKVDWLKENPNVCIEIDEDHELVSAEKACDWGMKYQSIIAFGEAKFITGLEEKKQALNVLMAQYHEEKKDRSFPENMIAKTTIIKVVVNNMTGKGTKKL